MKRGAAHAEWVVDVLVGPAPKPSSEMVKLSTRSLDMVSSGGVRRLVQEFPGIGTVESPNAR